MFDIPMNLHYSQTQEANAAGRGRFDIPMNLHYSQTDQCCRIGHDRLIFL